MGKFSYSKTLKRSIVFSGRLPTVPDVPTLPPRKPPRPAGRPALETAAPILRGPLAPPEVRQKQPSVPDVTALVAQAVADAVAGMPKPAAPQSPAGEHPDQALGAAVRTILKQTAAVLAAAIVGAAVTAYTRPTADPAKVEAQAVQIKGSDAAVIALQADVSELKRWRGSMGAWAQDWAPFELQLWNKLGVKVEMPKEYREIQTVTPQHWAQVKAPPLFEVRTSPPLPPKD